VSWDGVRALLAVRLDALGDVLMTTPALRALRAGRLDRRITLLTSPAGGEVAALVPEIDEVIVYDAPWMKATAARGDSAPDHAMLDRLRRARFEGAVIFTVFSQNPLPAALLCFLADVPRRLAHCRENPYQLLTDWVAEPEPTRQVRHEVRRQLDLVDAIGCAGADERLSLRVPEAARSRVADRLATLGLHRRPWVLVHPGATAASRRYPPARFAAAARGVARATRCAVVVTGAAAERPLVDDVLAALDGDAHALVGLGLADFAALVEAAPLLITNNSGPVHVAAAVGTPVIDLYALTNPQHTPWAVPHRVLFRDVPCKYCYKSVCPEGHGNCLALVEPAEVVEAALALLQERDP
jgi:lipopolysaccharide heptosyltransferase II